MSWSRTQWGHVFVCSSELLQCQIPTLGFAHPAKPCVLVFHVHASCLKSKLSNQEYYRLPPCPVESGQPRQGLLHHLVAIPSNAGFAIRYGLKIRDCHSLSPSRPKLVEKKERMHTENSFPNSGDETSWTKGPPTYAPKNTPKNAPKTAPKTAPKNAPKIHAENKWSLPAVSRQKKLAAVFGAFFGAVFHPIGLIVWPTRWNLCPHLAR